MARSELGNRADDAIGAAWGGVLSLPTLIGWLAVAATVELLILRTFTRIAIHVPGLSAVAGPYEALSDTGRFAYYVATVLAIVAALVVMVTAWQSGRVGGRVVGGSVAVLLAAGGALRAGPDLGEAAALNSVLLAALFATGLGAALLAGRRQGATIAACSIAVGLSGAFSVSQMWAGEGVGGGLPATLLDAAEWMAIAFAVVLPWGSQARKAPGRLPAAAGIAMAVVTLAMLMGNPSTSRFLLLWTHGLTGALPAVAYAAAAGCLAATAVAFVRRGNAMAGLSIVLIAAGGVAMQNTYQTMLVAIGLACLGLATSAGAAALTPAPLEQEG